MEFNNTNKEIISVISSKTEGVTETVMLKSSDRASVTSIPNMVKVNTSLTIPSMVTVTHDVRELKSQFSDLNVKTSLINIYGKDGKIFTSNRDIESVNIPLSSYPARLEYNFTVVENGIEVEYKGDHTLSSNAKESLISVSGKVNNSQVELTIPQAVSKLDDELSNIKNNLQNFSFIYDESSKKYVNLQNYLLSISSKLDILTKDIADVKEKTKDL